MVRSIGVFVCVHVKWVRSWIMPRFVEIAGVNTISHTQSCSGRAAGSKICERPPRGPGEARLDIAAPNKAGGAGVVSPAPPTPLSRRTDHLTDVGMRRRKETQTPAWAPCGTSRVSLAKTPPPQSKLVWSNRRWAAVPECHHFGRVWPPRPGPTVGMQSSGRNCPLSRMLPG